jgi:hypothetical protein
MVDWTKPIRTDDGRPARVLDADWKYTSRERAGVLIAVDNDNGLNFAVVRTSDNRLVGHEFGREVVIVNVPERKSRWVAVWPTIAGGVLELSTRAFLDSYIANCTLKAIGILELIFEDDQLVDTVIHHD